MELTEKQRKILNYIESQLREKGYPPTIREIGRRFSISSTRGVRDHLKALANKKYIERIPWASRGIRLLKENDRLSIPIAGRVVAGAPELALEDIEGELKVDERMKKHEKTFALKVKGESMAGAGICEGDYVVVRPQNTSQPGDIVVALIEDEATIKRFVQKGNRFFLEPANPSYQSIEVSEKVKVIGKVVGLIRYYR